MPKKNEFKLDVVSVRLVKDAPIYSERPFNSPYEVVAALGNSMCELDREVVCVVNVDNDHAGESAQMCSYQQDELTENCSYHQDDTTGKPEPFTKR